MKTFIIVILSLISFCTNAQTYGTNLIQNGNFSSNYSNWSVSGSSWYISGSFSCFYSSSAYGYVGTSTGVGANSVSGSLYQTVTIPSNATAAALIFMLSVNTDETTTTTAFDYLYAELRNTSGTPLTTLATYSNLNGAYPQTGCQTYQTKAISIPSTYYGQTVRINFRNSNDASLPTRFRIDDVMVGITQPCTYTLSQSSYNCPNSSGNTYSNIASISPINSSCTWSASVTSGSSWLSTSSSGTGNGSISITVTANTGTSSRTGTIVAGGQSLTITQPGVSCTYSLSQNSYTCPNASASTYNNIINVTTASGCSWSATVTSGGGWLSTTSSSSGNGSISITVTANMSTSSRSGTINIAGQTLTISQPGINCTYSLSSSNYTCPNSNAATHLNVSNVNTQSGCTWSAIVTTGGGWLSTSSSGTGNGQIDISVASNTGGNSRSGTIDIAGQTLNIIQPGSSQSPDLTITSPTANIVNLVPNASTTLSYDVKNVGNGTAGNSITSFFLSQDNKFDAGIDLWVKDENIPSIAGTGSHTGSAVIKIPNNTPPGTWFIIIISDAPNNVGESDESNNTSFVSLTIGTSLSCANDDYPYGAFPGGPCNLTYGTDTWSFYRYQCVSFVAWKVNQFWGYTSQGSSDPFHNYMYKTAPAAAPPDCNTGGNYRLSDACHWDDVMAYHGVSVNGTPAVGSIAHWNEGENGTKFGSGGHVGFVTSVSNNIICISNYNGWDGTNLAPCRYGYFQVDMSQPFNYPNNLRPGRFIHTEGSGQGSAFIPSSDKLNNMFNIYPNPTTGIVNIKFNSESSDLAGNITVLNSLGQVILSREVTTLGTHQVDFSSLQNGIYYIKITTSSTSGVKRCEVIR